jgi:nitrite reductase (NO-forming)
VNLAISSHPSHPDRPDAGLGASRIAERQILQLGIALAGTFLLAAVASGALPLGPLHGWVATHLSLAGAATVAIGTFMPHFGVTLAGTRPEPWPLRLAGVLLLFAGMATVALGRPLVDPAVAAAGGLAVLVGIGLTAWTTFAPMRSGLARRHPIVQVTYAVALADLTVGASLATMFLFGWTPVIDHWVALKPAHAWLNVMGFVSLTVAGTLVYLYPTIVGARIRAHPSMAAAVVGLLLGPPLAAAGYAVSLEPLALAGAGMALVGAAGLLWYGIDTWLRRGQWARDLAWHDVAARHGLAAMAWFVAAAAAMAARILQEGVVVPGWALGIIAIPIIGGWVAQVLVAAWSYLLPAVGPGDMAAKGRQRAVLAWAAVPRLVAWNVGLLLLWPGLAFGVTWLFIPGALLFAPAALASLALLFRALMTAAQMG